MTPLKRAFDVAAAGLGLAVAWPALVAAAAAVKWEDGGEVFFRQERVGRDGKPFRIWKLRTMVPDAERAGRQLTVGTDPRITRAGAWLRRFKLDELPQLVNVLRGEMSFVGPRPEVPRYVARYTPEQREVLRYVPGITDPASIAYRRESELLEEAKDPERLYVEEIMPAKIRINLAYARQACIWSDLAVIMRTLAHLHD